MTFATKLHHKHLCKACGVTNDHIKSSIGNPLAIMELKLDGDKLHLTWRDDLSSADHSQSQRDTNSPVDVPLPLSTPPKNLGEAITNLSHPKEESSSKSMGGSSPSH
jgi:hypothetical protein